MNYQTLIKILFNVEFFRISEAEIRAETAERAAQRLQKDVDRLQNEVLQENQKKRRIEEDMQGLMSDLDMIQ